MPEVMGSASVLAELDAQWNAANVVEPSFIDINTSTSPLRVNLIPGDQVLIYQTSFVPQPIGTWVYEHQITTVFCDLHTIVNRQRLYNLYREIRRICNDRIHSMSDYQRVQCKEFNEFTQEQVNIWSGRVVIELTNSAILRNIST